MSMSFGIGGKSEKSSGSASETQRQTSQLELEQSAIDKIISDVLGGADGLANIFNQSNSSGVYDSTTDTNMTTDLVTNLVGELAKLTGKQVDTLDASKKEFGKVSGFNAGFSMGKKES
jgi:hypothetical protein